jgi:hypothetical protein
MVAMHQRYTLSPAVAIEDFPEGSLALHCVTLHLLELNATARDLLQRLDGRASLREIAAALADEYGQPLADLERDLGELVAQLVELCFAECIG